MPTVMRPPVGVNLMALPMRFSNTCSIRWRSAKVSGTCSARSSRSSIEDDAASVLLRVDGLHRHIARPKLRAFDRELTGFDARDVEQILDESLHPPGGALDAFGRLPGASLGVAATTL